MLRLEIRVFLLPRPSIHLIILHRGDRGVASDAEQVRKKGVWRTAHRVSKSRSLWKKARGTVLVLDDFDQGRNVIADPDFGHA